MSMLLWHLYYKSRAFMTTGFSVLYLGLCILEVFARINLNCGVIHMCGLLMIHLYLK